ncbi:MAG: hypothetical protein HKP61_02870 [Dactylosporangium sp.]|nr:hypothetical protein [Dactylosporangium sp.]NNJ59902.1 hypothetical protein [Dactylosporangium sp.]
MVGTALSMRGHLAWMLGQTGPMPSLSQAAQWPPAKLAVTANAVQQEARAHAILGDGRACDDAFDRAEDLASAAAETDGSAPPWMYFYNPDMLTMQRSLAQLYLGREEQASEFLESGLARMSPDQRTRWKRPQGSRARRGQCV